VQDGAVPEPAASDAERKRRARQVSRRRELTRMLAIVECTARYGASALGDGMSPAEAREVALFIAGELELMAEALRRLTRLEPDDRRELARQLARLGWSRRAIAARIGVSERAVWSYLRPGPAASRAASAGA
jgi:hypothetical protein